MHLLGKIGILRRTTEAKKNSENASDLEYLRVEATSELIDYYQGNDGKNEDEYILEKWSNNSNSKISVNKTDKTVTYNGKTYAMSDIIGNESEKKKITGNNMNQVTISNAEKAEDKELLSNGKVRIIVEEENGMRAVIPNGFYYVTGKPSNGMVISDIYGDDDNNSKGGNQFVWVPCSVDKGATDATDNGTTVTYEKVNGLAVTWKNRYKTESYYTTTPSGYTATSDWRDVGGNTDSVKKYGGFYIARYEAGLPEDKTLWSKDGGTYGWTNGENAGSLSGNRNEKNGKQISEIEGIIPVSKKNNASWNRISQINAEEVSKKMYAGSETVTSSLVDSYAWDTILGWYEKTAKANGSTIDCKNSTGYGNYFDTPFGIPTNSNEERPNKLSLKNVLYAVHKLNISTWVWTEYDSKYNYLTTDNDATPKKEEVNSVRTVYEIATGSSDYTKVNNIYDMAGNMWEWTTEVRDYENSSNETGKFAARRGGCFSLDKDVYPVSYRSGNINARENVIDIGFRVILYITL